MTDCAAPRHDGQDEPTPAEPHAHLCKPCRWDLAKHLRHLPRMHAELAELPTRGHGDGSGLPFSEPAAECRSQIRHDLTHWTRHVTRILGDDAPPPPEIHGDSWSTRPVYAMAGWLAGQVSRSTLDAGWICYRGWAPEMAGAIEDNYGRAKTLLDPWVIIRFEVPGDLGFCLNCEEARIVVTVYPTEGDRRGSFIACPGCGRQWDTTQWLKYGHDVNQRHERQLAS